MMGGYGFFVLCVCVVLAVIAIAGAIRGRRETERERARLLHDFGTPPGPVKEDPFVRIQRVGGYYRAHLSEETTARGHIDDITWNDLGMDAVFDRLDTCQSAAGEEILYDMLRRPQLVDDFSRMEEQIQAVTKQPEDRVRLQLFYRRIGRPSKYSLYDYLSLLEALPAQSDVPHLAALAVIVLAIVLIIAGIQAGIWLLILVLFYNVIAYYRTKGVVEPYYITLRYLLRELAGAEGLVRTGSQIFDQELAQIAGLVRGMGSFRRGSDLVMGGGNAVGSGNPVDLLMDYIRMLTHIDLIKFNQMVRVIRGRKEAIDELQELMGRIEAVIAIASFRESLRKQGVCVPDFAMPEQGYALTEGYHPLMATPVKNTIETRRGVLITGSNASGKSTFLKTCAINAILAQSVHTCAASGYRAPLYRIYSSMALRDDLDEGESYYIVEIKSLKRILDAADAAPETPLLCFIDEVLRGTNTVERIAASCEILRCFSGQQTMCFAATHDGELTELLSEDYDLYHFEGEIRSVQTEDGTQKRDVHFDYTLRDGAATTRNAIELLSILGYDDAVTDRAQALATSFEQTGRW